LGSDDYTFTEDCSHGMIAGKDRLSSVQEHSWQLTQLNEVFAYD